MATRVDELKAFLLLGIQDGIIGVPKVEATKDDDLANDWYEDGWNLGRLMLRWRRGSAIEAEVTGELNRRVVEAYGDDLGRTRP